MVGRLVNYAVEKGKPFGEPSPEEYKSFSPSFDEGVYKITAESWLKARDVIGGTAPKRVVRALAEAGKIVEKGE